MNFDNTNLETDGEINLSITQDSNELKIISSTFDNNNNSSNSNILQIETQKMELMLKELEIKLEKERKLRDDENQLWSEKYNKIYNALENEKLVTDFMSNIAIRNAAVSPRISPLLYIKTIRPLCHDNDHDNEDNLQDTITIILKATLLSIRGQNHFLFENMKFTSPLALKNTESNQLTDIIFQYLCFKSITPEISIIKLNEIQSLIINLEESKYLQSLNYTQQTSIRVLGI